MPVSIVGATKAQWGRAFFRIVPAVAVIAPCPTAASPEPIPPSDYDFDDRWFAIVGIGIGWWNRIGVLDHLETEWLRMAHDQQH